MRAMTQTSKRAPEIKKQRSQDKQLVREVVAERRRQSIASREAERKAALERDKETQESERHLVRSKYPKGDILALKAVFDKYDVDGSGFIERSELARALQRQKDHVVHFDGRKTTLEERQAARGLIPGLSQQRQEHQKEGIFLVDFAESMFRTMDANSDGQVAFIELLRTLYPYATEAEVDTFMSWVSPEEPKIPLDDFYLDDTQRAEIRAMFALYDRDRSGTISPTEFRQAMKRCGMDAAETNALFAEVDTDGNKSIDVEEFTSMMRLAIYNGEKLTREMLYAPI